MRQITVVSFLIIFLTSYSTKKESDNQLVSIAWETSELSTLQETEQTICDTLTATIGWKDGKIELRLSDQGIQSTEFELVADNFYASYIEPNDIFRKRSNSFEQGGIETQHYYHGLTNHNGYCLILVYEYFILNHSDTKLFLLAINSEGQLATTIQVAELTEFPGGEQRTSSSLYKNQLRVVSVTDEILGPYNEESNKYQYIMDSITTDYNVDSWLNVKMLKSDSISGIKYWK